MIYAFIETEKTNHRVSAMCRALKVSKSGFYGWRDRAPSARTRADAPLLEKIVRIRTDSRETYGAPRIHFELRVLGERLGAPSVSRAGSAAPATGCFWTHASVTRAVPAVWLCCCGYVHIPTTYHPCGAMGWHGDSGTGVGLSRLAFSQGGGRSWNSISKIRLSW